MRALLLVAVLAVACSSRPDQSAPSPTPSPTPTPGQDPSMAPTPNPAPTPGQAPTPPGGADCASDADCTTTTYGPEPAKDTGSCCASLSCPRVETAKRAEELSAAFSKLCGAVRCRPPDCPGGEPAATCQAGRCAAR